jgi:hypothetical protein
MGEANKAQICWLEHDFLQRFAPAKINALNAQQT